MLVPRLAVAQVNTSGSFVSNTSAPCAPACSAQNFDTDPFAAPYNRWTIVNNDSDCPIVWDSVNKSIGRDSNVGTGCLSSPFPIFARYNGVIAGDSCTLFQLGGSGNLAWQPGFIIRDRGNNPITDPHWYSDAGIYTGLNLGASDTYVGAT